MANKKIILDALGEAREHLILGKYNDAMMLMAQITIDVIEHLTDEALIVSKGYEEDLKTLTTMGILTEDSAHNFNTLIISGVQAHNGVEIPKEHAEQALEVLSNELDIIFKRDDNKTLIADDMEEKAKFNASTKKSTDENVFEYDEDEPYPGDFSKDMTMDGSAAAFMQTGDEEDFRKKERLREQMLTKEKNKSRRSKSKLIAIIIPIVLVLLIVFVVKAMFFSADPTAPKASKAKKQKVQETIVAEVETTETTETEPTTKPLPPEAGYYDVTGDLVKIRNAATTEGSKVIGTVNKGDKVHVKSFYNKDWAVVTFEGRDAYVSRRYIKKDESLSPVFEESGVAPSESTESNQ